MPRVENKSICCSIDKFFHVVATGSVNAVKNLNYCDEHLTADLTFSPPGYPIYITNATPLHVAAQRGHVEMVKFLINELKEVTACKKYPPFTSIVDWAMYNANKDKFEFYVNYEDRNEYTPLHAAVENNHSEVVKLLLNNKANINASSEAGYTPLHLAIVAGKLEMVDLLLQLGADPSTRCGSANDTALHLAIKSNHPATAQTICLLIYYGAKLDAKNGKSKVVYIFENNAIGIDLVNKYGKTPSQIAAELSKANLANTLKQHIHIQKASLNLLKYIRLLKLNFANGLFKYLPEEIFQQIILSAAEADSYINDDQLKKIYNYALDKSILLAKNTKISFFQKTIYSSKDIDILQITNDPSISSDIQKNSNLRMLPL